VERHISIQQKLLDTIKRLTPSNNSLAGVLSAQLGISTDSAYRRIRGETLFSIDEVSVLCNHFKVSFDSLNQVDTGLVTFRFNPLNDQMLGFKTYLESLKRDLAYIKSMENKKIIYACQDIPVFHDFNYPELSGFKMFYWMKSIMNVPELQDKVFHVSRVPEGFYTLGKQIYELYASIPSTEIWTETTIVSTLKQIEFFNESGSFGSIEDALQVCNGLKQLLENVREQTEHGHKHSNGGKDINGGAYDLYLSEIEITNNCVLVNIQGVRSVFLGHLTFNTMSTSNEEYSKKTESWLEVIIKKSTLVSGVSEKHRYQFFRKALKRVDDLMQKIENG
jgi:hypothetical protein